jgi:hypothetical protein
MKIPTMEKRVEEHLALYKNADMLHPFFGKVDSRAIKKVLGYWHEEFNRKETVLEELIIDLKNVLFPAIIEKLDGMIVQNSISETASNWLLCIIECYLQASQLPMKEAVWIFKEIEYVIDRKIQFMENDKSDLQKVRDNLVFCKNRIIERCPIKKVENNFYHSDSLHDEYKDDAYRIWLKQFGFSKEEIPAFMFLDFTPMEDGRLRPHSRYYGVLLLYVLHSGIKGRCEGKCFYKYMYSKNHHSEIKTTIATVHSDFIKEATKEKAKKRFKEYAREFNEIYSDFKINECTL